MKKVMLIGDSIRLGYQEQVAKNLEGIAEVWGSEDNCRFAKYTLNELGRMFEACGKPDVIHWNNGLWDTSIVYPEDGSFTSVDEYLRDMSRILRELRKVTDKIIFATTTPVKPQNPNQKNEIITEYNKQIKMMMEKENVIINDLNALVSSHIDQYICEDHIHLNEAGKIVCGRRVADEILKIL